MIYELKMDNNDCIGLDIVKECSWKNGLLENSKLGNNQQKIWMSTTLQLEWEVSNFLLSRVIFWYYTCLFAAHIGLFQGSWKKGEVGNL